MSIKSKLKSDLWHSDWDGTRTQEETTQQPKTIKRRYIDIMKAANTSSTPEVEQDKVDMTGPLRNSELRITNRLWKLRELYGEQMEFAGLVKIIPGHETILHHID